MLARRREAESAVSVEMTPMIDMVFLLLIFFLVATTFHQEEREMQIALPVAQSAGPISTALRELIVNIDEAGTIIVGGNPMEPAALDQLVRELVVNNPDQKVTVRGDRRSAYANVVNVLDICKNAGIQQPYLDTVLTE